MGPGRGSSAAPQAIERTPGPAATKVLHPYALTARGSRKRPENGGAEIVSTFGASTLVSAGPGANPTVRQFVNILGAAAKSTRCEGALAPTYHGNSHASVYVGVG